MPPRVYPAQQWNDPPMLDGDGSTNAQKSTSLSSKYGRVSAQNLPIQSPQASHLEYPSSGSFQQQQQQQHYSTSYVDPQIGSQTYSTQAPIQSAYLPAQPQFSNIESVVSPVSAEQMNTVRYQQSQQGQYPMAYPSNYEAPSVQLSSSSYFQQKQTVAQQYPSHVSSSILKLENVEVPAESVPLVPLVPLPSIQVSKFVCFFSPPLRPFFAGRLSKHSQHHQLSLKM